MEENINQNSDQTEQVQVPAVAPGVPNIDTQTPNSDVTSNKLLKKRTVIILSIITSLVIFLVLLLIFFLGKKPSSGTKSNGTTVTNYQIAPESYKTYSNNCFTTQIPDSSVINESGCSVDINAEDTTTPYVKVTAVVKEGGTNALEGSRLIKSALDEQLAGDKSYINSSFTLATTTINGIGAYKIPYVSQSVSVIYYLIDARADSNFVDPVSGLRIDAFLSMDLTEILNPIFFQKNLTSS